MLPSSPKVPAPKTLCLSKDLTLQQEDNNYYTDLSETGKAGSENRGFPLCQGMLCNIKEQRAWLADPAP